MEEKILELVTKMYTEFVDFRSEMLAFKADMLAFKDDMLTFKDDTTSFREYVTAKLDQNTADIKVLTSITESHSIKLQNIDNHVISLENTLSEKTSVLFDGYKLLDCKFDRLETKLDNVNNIVEKQAVEIRVIQGGRK